MSFERYIKNTNAFSKEEIEQIHLKKVCVIGCGGLGGYVAQILARFGVLNLVVVDGDVFCESNLNRQVFASEVTIGKNKAEVCKEKINEINSSATVAAYAEMFSEDNAKQILQDVDLVMDCLDNPQSRLLLERCCESASIPFVHGAIAGFYGQVSIVFPGDKTMEWLYKNKQKGIEQQIGNPSFTPPLIASIQCCEGIKFLTGKKDILRNKLLFIDLMDYDTEIIELARD